MDEPLAWRFCKIHTRCKGLNVNDERVPARIESRADIEQRREAIFVSRSPRKKKKGKRKEKKRRPVILKLTLSNFGISFCYDTSGRHIYSNTVWIHDSRE